MSKWELVGQTCTDVMHVNDDERCPYNKLRSVGLNSSSENYIIM